MSFQSIIIEVDHGVGILTLNRADRHNVLDKTVVMEMIAGLHALEATDQARVIVLSSIGKSFCAGIDPAWMRQTVHAGEEDKLCDNRDLAHLLSTLARLGKPTVARVHGAASGIGVGLVAACDIAFATYDASFALNDVRHGLVPAVASPYLVAAMGERYCRYYMLTGERFSGLEAYRIGLGHEMLPDDEQLDEAVGETVDILMRNGVQAMNACKNLLRSITGQPIDETTLEETIRSAVAAQTSTEGREGMLALVEKRKPVWSTGA